MTSRQAVVAVVAHYNAGKDADAALDAIAASRGLAGLLIVDDCSSPESFEQVGSWAAKRRAGPWVELLRNPENVGPARAFARGIQRALERGAGRVWLLDQDMRPDPGCLAALQDALDRDPSASAATPTRTNPEGGFTYRQYEVRGTRLRAVSGGPFRGITVFSGLLLADPRRALAVLPQDYFIDSDDFAFTLRLSREVGPLVHAPAARAQHACGIPAARLMGRPVLLSQTWRLYYRARNQAYFARLATTNRLQAAILYLRTFLPVAAVHVLYQRPLRAVLAGLTAGWRDARRGVRGRRP